MSGSPAFIREVLADLPQLLTGLRAAAPATVPPAIALPASPETWERPRTDHAAPTANGGGASLSRAGGTGISPVVDPPVPTRAPSRSRVPTEGKTARAARTPEAAVADDDDAVLEAELIELLRSSRQPQPVSSLRQRLRSQVSGQQVRRVLERSSRVVAQGERPATYSVR